MNLYTITNEYARLAAAYEDAQTDEERTQASDALAALDMSLADQADACARLTRNLKADSDKLAEEIKRLQELKKRKDSTAERIRTGLQMAMEAANVRRVDTSIGRWSVRKNPPSVMIVDAAEIPEDYLVPQPPKVNAAAIRDHFKATGEIVPGTEIHYGEGLQLR